MSQLELGTLNKWIYILWICLHKVKKSNIVNGEVNGLNGITVKSFAHLWCLAGLDDSR